MKIELTNEEKRIPPEQWPLRFFMKDGMIDQYRTQEFYTQRKRAWYEWVDHDGGKEYRQLRTHQSSMVA